MAGMIDPKDVGAVGKAGYAASDVARYPYTGAKQFLSGMTGSTTPVSSTPNYDAYVRGGSKNAAGTVQKLGAATADVLMLPLRGMQALGHAVDPAEIGAVNSYTPMYDTIRSMPGYSATPPSAVAPVTLGEGRALMRGTPGAEPQYTQHVPMPDGYVAADKRTEPTPSPVVTGNQYQTDWLKTQGITPNTVAGTINTVGMAAPFKDQEQLNLKQGMVRRLEGNYGDNAIFVGADKEGRMNQFTGVGTAPAPVTQARSPTNIYNSTAATYQAMRDDANMHPLTRQAIAYQNAVNMGKANANIAEAAGTYGFGMEKQAAADEAAMERTQVSADAAIKGHEISAGATRYAADERGRAAAAGAADKSQYVDMTDVDLVTGGKVTRKVPMDLYTMYSTQYMKAGTDEERTALKAKLNELMYARSMGAQ